MKYLIGLIIVLIIAPVICLIVDAICDYYDWK